MGESFWQKNRLVTHILFDLCLYEHFSPVANFEQQSMLKLLIDKIFIERLGLNQTRFSNTPNTCTAFFFFWTQKQCTLDLVYCEALLYIKCTNGQGKCFIKNRRLLQYYSQSIYSRTVSSKHLFSTLLIHLKLQQVLGQHEFVLHKIH